MRRKTEPEGVFARRDATPPMVTLLPYEEGLAPSRPKGRQLLRRAEPQMGRAEDQLRRAEAQMGRVLLVVACCSDKLKIGQ